MQSGMKTAWGVFAAFMIAVAFSFGFVAGDSGVFPRQTFDECMGKGLQSLPFKSLAHIFVECRKHDKSVGESVPPKWTVACIVHLSKGTPNSRPILGLLARFCGVSEEEYLMGDEVEYLLEQQEDK